MQSDRRVIGRGMQWLACIALVAALAACAGVDRGVPEPAVPRSKQVDVYHGTPVADPYRWLEEVDSAKTRAWIDSQNERTGAFVAELPARERFRERLARLIDYERRGLPIRRAGRTVYEWNSGLLEQDVVRVATDAAEVGRVLIDPATLSADGTVSIGGLSLSPDGRWLAWGLSDGGSDWRSWRIRDVETGQDRVERLEGIKFSSPTWVRDSSGFYYSRYPAATDGFDDTAQVAVYFHRLGDDQRDDRLVYRVTDHATRNPYARETEDGRYLLIELFDGYQANGVYVQRLRDGVGDGAPIRLFDDWDGRYEYLANDGERFLFKTTADAPLGRVIAVNLGAPDVRVEIVPESDVAMAAASVAGDALLITSIVDASARVRHYDLNGMPMDDVELPGFGTVDGFTGLRSDKDVYFAYSDFTTPPTLFVYDLATRKTRRVFQPQVAFDPAAFETRQHFVVSADGTRVPLYVVRRRNLPEEGPASTVLYGYGGFNVSLLPRYSTSRMAWLEAGGVYVSANLRGGGEYGEAWHQAGTRLNKQNTFDDFIAAADWLVDAGVTTSDRLAIWGGSNGGLLVGAVLLQRPELFAAAIPSVGVLDMLRYHVTSANARQWSSDYGLSEIPEEFAVLRSYSPVHNVVEGRCYPATLVMADANDDRVAPWHSYKFAAALQYGQGCRNPTLIRVESRSGHGAGASTSKIIEEYADQWAFVAAMTQLPD